MTANLDRHIAALAADPRDQRAFEALEEAYFLGAEWDKLVTVYRQRLEDPDLEDPRERAPLHYRLGQILEERCLDIDLAALEYTEAIRTDASYRPALRQLRVVWPSYRSRPGWVHSTTSTSAGRCGRCGTKACW